MNIILTGPIGAGKGEGAKPFLKRGFKVEYFHTPVYTEVEKRGLPPTRENLQNTSKDLKTKYGQGVYGKFLREKAEKEEGSWIFDGLRNLAELEELKKIPNTYLIGITAPIDILIERIKSRSRDADQEMSDTKIKEKILTELGKINPEYGFEIEKCLNKADLLIENTGTLEDLYQKIEKFIAEKSLD